MLVFATGLESARVRLRANRMSPHMSAHATAISAKNSGLCVTPAARLRLVFQRAPRPTEWSTSPEATSTAHRTIAAGRTRNRCIQMHSYQSSLLHNSAAANESQLLTIPYSASCNQSMCAVYHQFANEFKRSQPSSEAACPPMEPACLGLHPVPKVVLRFLPA